MAVQVYSKAQVEKIAQHLERQAEWRHVRLNGTRYVVIPSGHSDRVYWLDAANDRCSCLWFQRTQTSCSHLRALWESERPTIRPNRLAERRPTTIVGFCDASLCDGDRIVGEDYCERHVLVDAF